jgi:thymidine phosphorylase
MRNLSSSPRGQRDECLEFQEYVARSYELRNKIATRVGAGNRRTSASLAREDDPMGKSFGEALEVAKRQKCK